MKKLLYIFLLVGFLGNAQGIVHLDKLRQQQINDSSGGGASNEYTGTDAVGDDSNGVGNWAHQSGVTVNSVASTDLVLGDSYALEFKTTVGNAYKQAYIDLVGLPAVPLTATFRTRRLVGDGFIVNWSNVTSATYNVDYGSNGTDWFEGTVTFTPTGNVRIKVYASGDTGLSGSTIEISSLIITVN